MNEKRFTCETKTQGSVSIDLMKDNGQIIEKFEAINLLNELHEENTVLKEEIKNREDPHGMFICTDIGEVKRGPHLKKYSMCYSKTDEDTILEDHHVIDGIHPWNSLETKKHIVELLNDKEKQIYNLTKENDFLKWYCEELETHLPKELLKQMKEFYKNNVRKIGE